MEIKVDCKIETLCGMWSKTIQNHFTNIDMYYRIKLVDGQPEQVKQDKIEKPDSQYEMTTETFFASSRKELTGYLCRNTQFGYLI